MASKKKALGRSLRKGMSVVEFVQMYPSDAEAELWFIRNRWPSGVCCPKCGSLNVQVGCREKACCGRPRFSVKTRTIMEGCKLGYQAWLTAMFLLTTSLKSVSSMELHRDLGITQKSAWFMAHRLRDALAQNSYMRICDTMFAGPAKMDATHFGGKRKNMPKYKREQLTGRGSAGKTAVVGAKDRGTKQVAAAVVPDTTAGTLQGFAAGASAPDATVYTDDATAYDGLPRQSERVKHSVGEYVRGKAHTNGIESFGSMLKRAYAGTFHKLSPKHLDRYVQEFVWQHSVRDLVDTAVQLKALGRGMEAKGLTYKRLIAKNGLPSGARA